MIRHEAVTPYLDSLVTAPMGHQFQVGAIVPLVEKRLLPPVATLRNMVRHARNTIRANLAMPPIQLFPILPSII